MKKNIPIELPTAVLVAVNKNQLQAEDYLDELSFLAETYGLKVVQKFIQPLAKPVVGTYIGSGKIEEIKDYVEKKKIDYIIFDDELTPTIVRNLEKEFKHPILDRNMLILEIFSKNAQSAQAKAQVELARLQYMLPRLTRLWTHLERQRGGIGSKSGAGEKEIETDKRKIRNQITLLKKELIHIEQVNETQRKKRNNMVRVSLVGYTNVGKSSLMNVFSKANVLSENKLFATLDTTVRKVVFNQIPFLLADTVGFIRKLPHHLVECFKSTLKEVQESDLLIHVVDISHYAYQEHIEVVQKTLAELGCSDKKTILVFNKLDRLPAWEKQDFDDIWHQQSSTPTVFISATTGEGIPEFRDLLAKMTKDIFQEKFPDQVIPDYHVDIE